MGWLRSLTQPPGAGRERSPLELKPRHCRVGFPCRMSCRRLRLRQESSSRCIPKRACPLTPHPASLGNVAPACKPARRPWSEPAPLGGCCVAGAGLAVPGAVGVPGKAAVGTGGPVCLAAVQAQVRDAHGGGHVQLLLRAGEWPVTSLPTASSHELPWSVSRVPSPGLKPQPTPKGADPTPRHPPRQDSPSWKRWSWS